MPYGEKGLYFTVETKSGLKYTYEYTLDSRHRVNAGSQHTPGAVINYYVNKIEDRLGNIINFRYNNDPVAGECYIDEITYAGENGKIKFTYEARTDPIITRLQHHGISIEFKVAKRLTGINTYYNNELFRSYSLSYTSKGTNQTQYLESVGLEGRNGSTLNPTKFTYPDIPTSEYLYTPHDFSTQEKGAPFVGDFNGDGLNDICLAVSDKNQILFYENSGDGTFLYLHTIDDAGKTNRQIQIGDYNGDGISDVFYMYKFGDNNIGKVLIFDKNFNYTKSDLINSTIDPYIVTTGDFDGDGFADLMQLNSGGCYYGNPNTNDPLIVKNYSILSPHHSPDKTYYYADFNGSGRTDVLEVDISSSNHHAIYINTINSFEKYENNPYYDILDAEIGEEDKVLVGDFNGDMTADICIVKEDEYFSIYQGFGRGFVLTLENKNFPNLSKKRYISEKFNYFVGDFNGDGRSDILRSYYYFELIPDPVLSSDITVLITNISGRDLSDIRLSEDIPKNEEIVPSIVADINADGKSDIIKNITLQTLSKENAERSVWDTRYSDQFNLMILEPKNNKLFKVTNGLGYQQSITYKRVYGDIRTSGSIPDYPIAYLPGAIWVAHDINSNSYGSSNSTDYVKSTTYSFESPRVHMGGKGFLGFLTVTQKDKSEANYETTTVTEANNEIDPDYYYLRTAYSSKSFYLNDSPEDVILLSETFNEYDNKRYVDEATDTYKLNYFPYIKKTLTKTYDKDGNFLKVSRRDFSYNEWGDMLSSHLLQDTDAGLTLSSYGDQFDFREINTNEYYTADETDWVLGRLKLTYVTNVAPNTDDISRTSYFEYYNASSIFHGMLKLEKQQPLDDKWFQKKYEYHSNGTLWKTTVSGTGQEDRTHTTTYDGNGRFIQSSKNALNHSDNKTYDQLSGQVLTHTGPNGLTTEMEYEDFGVYSKKVAPDGVKEITVLRWVTENDIDRPENAVYYTWGQASGSPETKSYCDKLGREIRIVTHGFNNQKIYVDKGYYENSAVKFVSEPYFAGTLPSQIQYAEFEYDEIGRQWKVTEPGNRITKTHYDGLEVIATNVLNQVNSKVYNAAGWLIETQDNLNHSNTYQYYSNGLIQKIFDPKNHVTEMEYDKFGNRTKLIDPDLGTIDFVYNAFGELDNKTDANDNYTSYLYDKLGRMIYRNSPEGETTWIYDQAENGIGKLAEVHGPDVDEVYSYDEYLRVKLKNESVNGEIFETGYAYDILGRLKTMTYPSGFQVRNIYDQNSYLKQVRNYANNQMLWKADEMNARGQFVEFSLGNGLSTNYTYFAETGYLNTIQTPGIQDLEYGWDDIHNLYFRTDHGQPTLLKEYFIYDELNRLDFTIREGVQGLDMTYDEIGNIIYKSDVGSYAYDGPRPHAVTSVNGQLPEYYETLQTAQYTSFNKITHINQDGHSLDIVYGNSNERKLMTVKENGTIVKQKYFAAGGLYEKVIENNEVKLVHYIEGGSGLFAIYTESSDSDDEMVYVHTDHLGSIQSISDATGNLVEEYSYDAWGLRRNPENWEAFTELPESSVDRGFTGHEHLDIFALVNMNGRMYDPVIGRFLSPDPYSQMPEYTQGLNRYSYCLNNPLSHTDPSGYSIGDGGFASFAGFLVGAAVTVLTAGTGTPFAVAAIMGAAASGFTSGAMGAAFQGATFWQAMGAGITGGLMSTAIAGITHGIGGIGGIKIAFQKLEDATAKLINDFINLSVRSVAHGVFQGGMRFIQGGMFEHGLWSGFFSSFGLGAMSLAKMRSINYMIFGAAIGGTAEALGNGKFANGAITGAYVGLFNHAMHEWVPTREEASNVAANTTTTTGNETSVQVWRDSSGNDYFWVCPQHAENSPLHSHWIDPPPAETSDLELVEEFHYSVMYGPKNQKTGKQTIIMGSYADWKTASRLNIPIIHHTIGLGSWHFRPTKFFTQPFFTPSDMKYKDFHIKNPVRIELDK